MMSRSTLQRIDIEFKMFLKKKYPDAKSIRECTKMLNDELWRLMYAKKK